MSQELFKKCLKSWSLYDDVYLSRLSDKVRCYKFPYHATLFHIDLHLIDEISQESIQTIIDNFEPEHRYINIPTCEREETLKQINSLGYNASVKSSTTYNVWTKLVEADIPEGITVKSARMDSDIYPDYKQAMADFFGPDSASVAELNRKILIETESTHQVFILYDGSKIIASACYALHDNVCWFFGGSVHPDYRQKGIWKYLLYIRQQHSQALGAKLWFIQTDNDLIRGKSDQSFNADCILIQD